MRQESFFCPLDNQKGMALLVTLSVIAVILAVSFELNRRVRLSIMSTEQYKTEIMLSETARSGIEIAKAVLQQDASENNIDSVQENWADPEFMGELLTSLGYSPKALTITITDELGKIQVNALLKEFPGHNFNPDQKSIWENLLSFFINKDKSEDDRDPDEMINCLKDWLDNNDDDLITGVSGAESDYYQSLEPPYECANREIHDLNELYRVKGIKKNFLSFSKNMESFLPDEFQGVTDLKPEDLFTVYGVEQKMSNNTGAKKYTYSGKININTAPVPVIAALLPFGKQDLAEAIDTFRTEKADDAEKGFSNNLSMKGWYASAAGLTQEEKTVMEKKIVYSSNIYSIESKASLNGLHMTLKTVLLRKKNKEGRWYCKTLAQQIE